MTQVEFGSGFNLQNDTAWLTTAEGNMINGEVFCNIWLIQDVIFRKKQGQMEANIYPPMLGRV